VILGIILGLVVAAVVAIPVQTQHRQAVEARINDADLISAALEWGTGYAMLRDERRALREMVREVAGDMGKGVEAVRIFNKNGRVGFSSRDEEVGAQVDLKARVCSGCHYQADPRETRALAKRYWIDDQDGAGGYRRLTLVKPIRGGPSCSEAACHVHPRGKTVLGVASVVISLARVDSQRSAANRQAFIKGGVIFGVVGLILPALLYLLVNRPLSSLLAATRRVAAGDYEHPVGITSRDEIGALAQAFDQMRLRVKNNTEALDESRRLFQTMFEQVPCYISVQDRDLKLVAVNKKFENDFGRGLGDYCYAAYKGRETVCPGCAVAKTLTDGQVHASEETVIGQDGQPIYFLVLTAPIFDRNGRISSVMEMSTDITTTKRLEERLKTSEEKYRLLFNNDPNPIFFLDQNGLKILDANQRAMTALGYPRLRMTGRPFLELIAPEDRDRVARALAAGEGLVSQVQQVKGDGERLYADLRASYGEHLGREAIIVSASDITERLRAEQQLVQASKMATLGEMAAGVAHELNQPLSILGTGASFLLKRLAKEGRVQADVLQEVAQEMTQQVDRASKIINHLREFGRKSEVRRDRVDLNRPIRGVFELLGQQLRLRNIEVNTQLDPGLPKIWADANRIEQVFINLIINARDAIEKARAKNGKPVAGLIEIRSFPRDGRVWVEITDNGTGIDSRDRDRIFEPFFTTKEVGQGTGLGLSISYGIVTDYHGSIEVDSRPGRGTTFRLAFPSAAEEAP